MLIITETFAERLSTLRRERGLTVQQLATQAGVPATLISGLQNGSRQVGENNARKIGQALQLTDANLEQFVYMAINTSTERVLDSYKHYPSELINMVAAGLFSAGIMANDIRKCLIRSEKTKDTALNAAVFLADGRKAEVEVRVKT